MAFTPSLRIFDFRETVSNSDPYYFLLGSWHFVTMCLPMSPRTGPTQAAVGWAGLDTKVLD